PADVLTPQAAGSAGPEHSPSAPLRAGEGIVGPGAGTTADLPRGPAPSMRHWTEPATGEVPEALSGPGHGGQAEGHAGGPAPGGRGPRWRDQHGDWQEADFEEGFLLDDEEAGLGPAGGQGGEESNPDRFDEPLVRASASSGAEPGPAEASPAKPIRTRPPLDHETMDYGGGSRRDVRTAVITGIAVGILALLAFKLGPLVSLLVVLAVITLAGIEVFSVLRRAGYRPATLLGLTATVAILIGAYTKGEAAIPLIVVMTVVFSLLWYFVGAARARPTINVAVTLLGFVWVGVLGSFAALLLNPTLHPHRRGVAFLFGAVLATVAYDVVSFLFGSQFGHRPLAPEVSPNKTWEGLIAGMVAAVFFSVLIVGNVHPWSFKRGLALGLVVAVMAPLGDLCESMIKRDIGVKDMGAVLPGHGGLLDRFDAMLFVLPSVYYLVRLLKIG
ncbi:MAG TPA: phosphatidate cytidylyltransferase, partial [Acidimicrobiales bacterium]|nr:phosphatidate cytidylyltransferase [Acidimicrobiales bacterium]